MRRIVAIAVLALALGGCVQLDEFGDRARPEPEDDPVSRPVGPIIELGEVPMVGTDRSVRYEGFRNAAGGVCISSGEGGMTCGGSAPAAVPTLPASGPVGLSWGGDGTHHCVEAELHDEITRAVVTDADGVTHELRHLAGARQLGTQLYVACWAGGAEPRRLDATTSDGQLAYSADM